MELFFCFFQVTLESRTLRGVDHQVVSRRRWGFTSALGRSVNPRFTYVSAFLSSGPFVNSWGSRDIYFYPSHYYRVSGFLAKFFVSFDHQLMNLFSSKHHFFFKELLFVFFLLFDTRLTSFFSSLGVIFFAVERLIESNQTFALQEKTFQGYLI